MSIHTSPEDPFEPKRRARGATALGKLEKTRHQLEKRYDDTWDELDIVRDTSDQIAQDLWELSVYAEALEAKNDKVERRNKKLREDLGTANTKIGELEGPAKLGGFVSGAAKYLAIALPVMLAATYFLDVWPFK